MIVEHNRMKCEWYRCHDSLLYLVRFQGVFDCIVYATCHIWSGYLYQREVGGPYTKWFCRFLIINKQCFDWNKWPTAPVLERWQRGLAHRNFGTRTESCCQSNRGCVGVPFPIVVSVPMAHRRMMCSIVRFRSPTHCVGPYASAKHGEVRMR